MEKYQIPQIALKHFIQPGNKQCKDKYRDNRSPSFLPMIQCKEDTRNNTTDQKRLTKHHPDPVKNKSPENDLLIRHNQERGQQQQENVIDKMMPDKIKI